MRLIALFCLTFFTLPLRAEVTVFAAASLRGALDEVNANFPGNVVVSYASSAALARQIAQGAPADIFLSANPDWVDYLNDEAFVKLHRQSVFLSNRLVLIGSREAENATIETLPSVLQGRNFAMALTTAVPAGIYGREALKNLDIWRQVEPHLVQTDNVRAALALVALSEVDYALVYQTDANAEGRVRLLDEVPTEAHLPIRYVAALTADSAEAAQYFDFLSAEMSMLLFLKHGFLPPEGPR